MLKIITVLIPNFFKKNGMVKIKRVSDIWEMDIIMAGYFTAIVLV